jgi:hypothetical protein
VLYSILYLGGWNWQRDVCASVGDDTLDLFPGASEKERLEHSRRYDAMVIKYGHIMKEGDWHKPKEAEFCGHRFRELSLGRIVAVPNNWRKQAATLFFSDAKSKLTLPEALVSLCIEYAFSEERLFDGQLVFDYLFELHLLLVEPCLQRSVYWFRSKHFPLSEAALLVSLDKKVSPWLECRANRCLLDI